MDSLEGDDMCGFPDHPSLVLARSFLTSHFKGKPNTKTTAMPWANHWAFFVLHSLRVENYAVALLSAPEYGQDDENSLLVRLSAILHDLGRIGPNHGHALYSAEIVSSWLEGEGSVIGLSISQTERLLHLIRRHSSKGEPDGDPLVGLLQDADQLDEIGAMSILMNARWTDADTPYYYERLAERLDGREKDYGQKVLQMMHTDIARSLLRQKLDFIDQFAQQLRNELAAPISWTGDI